MGNGIASEVSDGPKMSFFVSGFGKARAGAKKHKPEVLCATGLAGEKPDRTERILSPVLWGAVERVGQFFLPGEPMVFLRKDKGDLCPCPFREICA